MSIGALRREAKNFGLIVRDRWLSVDEQLLQVLQSIGNVRERLPVENNLLRKYEPGRNLVNLEVMGGEEKKDERSWNQLCNNDWKTFGFRSAMIMEDDTSNISTTGGHLVFQDVKLAFSHDLRQHEKLLSYVRKLLKSLADVQAELGRSLDRAILWQFDSPDDKGHETVQRMTELFHMFSHELYRKQRIATKVILSMEGLVTPSSSRASSSSWWYPRESNEEVSAMEVVTRGCDQWPTVRNVSYSHVNGASLEEFWRDLDISVPLEVGRKMTE